MSFKQVGKLVELPELPLGKECLCAIADERRVLVKLLFLAMRIATSCEEKAVR